MKMRQQRKKGERKRGGDYPQNDDETDATISELESRVAEKKAREARSSVDAKDEPGADG